MNMVEKFKEHKKEMKIKIEKAHKIMEDAAEKMANDVRVLVKDASKEDLEVLLDSKDDDIDLGDKLALIAAFAEAHKLDEKGLMIIGRL